MIGLASAILALGLFGVAGCGGGGESTSPLTKAEYVAQANKICASEAKKLDNEVEAYADKRNLRYRTSPPKKIFEEEAEEILIPAVERKVEQLQELAAPVKDEQEVAKMLAAAEQGLKEGKSDLFALIAGRTLTEARKLTTEYGLKECF